MFCPPLRSHYFCYQINQYIKNRRYLLLDLGSFKVIEKTLCRKTIVHGYQIFVLTHFSKINWIY